jgi:hypothetical protein
MVGGILDVDSVVRRRDAAYHVGAYEGDPAGHDLTRTCSPHLLR